MINEHEHAILIADLPEHGLQAGDVGVVVHVYKDERAYEIEFFTFDGETLDVATVEADQVRPVSSSDVMHARALRKSA